MTTTIHSTQERGNPGQTLGAIPAELFRPSAISNYVRNVFPASLAALRKRELSPSALSEEVAREAERDLSLQDVSSFVRSLEPPQARLVLLDLAVLQAGLVHSGAKVPERFGEILLACARTLNLPPCLTYGLLVRDNPAGDTRVFSLGAAAEIEKRFYLGHEAMEGELERALSSVQAARELLASEKPDSELALRQLRAAQENHGRVLESMRSDYGKLSLEAFREFRPYLMPVPPQTRGPSGLYSANHLALRLVVFGPIPPREDFQRAAEEFFPVQDRARLSGATQRARQGESLANLSRISNAAALEILALMDVVIKEEQAHVGAALRAVKGVASGEEGTGGAKSAHAFLEEGLAHLRAVREKFRGRIIGGGQHD